MMISSRHASSALCRPATRPGAPASSTSIRCGSASVHTRRRSTPADTHDQILSPTSRPILAKDVGEGSASLDTTYKCAPGLAVDRKGEHGPTRAVYKFDRM